MAGLRRLALALLGAISLGGAAVAQDRSPDLALAGTLTGADHQTYREIPFEVPPGVARVTVEVDYTGREARTTVDLGLRDPERFRGWSGGNKRRFTVAAEEATPSYLPGPIVPGTWHIVLGVPNIRQTATATFEARIWFERPGQAFAGFAAAPLRTEAGWYRGDLHTHTGHSDGSCQPQSRRGETDTTGRVPCPVFRTVETAAARGLDFIAVTDHNTTSHADALRELQIGYDRLLLIPGREITTFQGHANVFGPVAFIDFQVGSAHAPNVNTVIGQIEALGGLFSVNHPTLPSGEACMGCGWTSADTDWSRVDAIEVFNGGSMRALGGQAETPLAGIAFWEALLNQGHRITAIGGSDNHDPDLPPETASAIGRPTTVVWAQSLSHPALLDGIRSGRVFIDLDSDPRRAMEFSAEADGRLAEMGGDLVAQGTARFSVRARGVPGDRVEFVRNGEVVDALPLAPDETDVTRAVIMQIDGVTTWVRVNLRDRHGRLILAGNPIYLNSAKPGRHRRPQTRTASTSPLSSNEHQRTTER